MHATHTATLLLAPLCSACALVAWFERGVIAVILQVLTLGTLGLALVIGALLLLSGQATGTVALALGAYALPPAVLLGVGRLKVRLKGGAVPWGS